MIIIKKDVISSTNDFIKENSNLIENYTTVIAKYQTKGKGRLTRVWQSNDGENILMSIAVKEFKERKDLHLLSLVAGVAVHKFLSKYLSNLKIKWPNDILVDSKKICGILLEGQINNQSQLVIIGIGININQTYFSSEIDDITTSLKKETNLNYNVDELIEEFLKVLIKEIDTFLNNDNMFITYIRQHLFGINEVISYVRNDIECDGEIIDISTDGRLVVKQKEEILYFNSGEIKIKR